MRRLVVSWVVGIFVLVGTTLPATAGRMTFAYSALVGSQSPLWVAEGEGFFQKHGIDPTLVYIAGGRVVVQAVLGGDVQMAIVGAGEVIRADLEGANLVYVAVPAQIADFTLVTAKNITDMHQLRGKRIGIGRFGGGPDYTTRVALKKYGLRPDKDVQIIQMNTGQPGRLAALEAGAIEGVVINPPLTLKAKRLGFNLLLNYSKVIHHFINAGFATTRKYARENPQNVEASVKALLDAVRFIYSNEDGTLKIVRRYLKITNPVLLREDYQVILKEINKTLYPDYKGFEFILRQERKRNPAAAKAKPEDFLNTKFLDSLAKEGY